MTASRLLLTLTALAPWAVACSSAPQPRSIPPTALGPSVWTTPPAAPAKSDATALRAPTAYDLRRDIVDIRLSGVPIVAVHCHVEAQEVAGKPISIEVSWDPGHDDPLSQTLRFPAETARLTVACGSQPKALSNDPKAEWHWYACATGSCSQELPPPKVSLQHWMKALELSLQPTAAPAGTGKEQSSSPQPTLSVDVRWRQNVSLPATELQTSTGASVARPRSLDPLATVGDDLLKAAAGVAVDRARTAVMRILKQRVIDWTKKSGVPLPATVRVLESLRFEDVASRGRELERALLSDMRAALIAWIRKQQPDEGVDALLARFDAIFAGYLDGMSLPTERDFQTVVYELAALKGGTGSWQKTVSMAASVAAECSADGPCSADKLVRALERESREAGKRVARGEITRLVGEIDRARTRAENQATALSAACGKASGSCAWTVDWNQKWPLVSARVDELKNALGENDPEELVRKVVSALAATRAALASSLAALPEREASDMGLFVMREHLDLFLASVDPVTAWPELRSLTARMAEVMQPPPSATPRQTAALATQITFDVLEAAAQRARVTTKKLAWGPESVSALRALRALTVAAITGDTRAGLTAALGELAHIADADAKTTRRATEVLGAIIEYASTYKKDGDSESTTAAAAEQRKKALSGLVESLTDRSARADGDGVLSIGVAVGLGYYDVEFRNKGAQNFSSIGVPTLGLPLGLAYDVLPAERGCWCGFHAQLNVFDLAQFVNVTRDGRAETPGPATAVDLGAVIGVTALDKSTPLFFGVHAGWAPGHQVHDDAQRGAFKLGGLVGTYIPFVDFN